MTTIGENPLPAGWKWAKLEDVCIPVRGVTFASDEASYEDFEDSIACLTTSGVQKSVDWNSRRFIPAHNVKQEQYLRKDDLLVSTANSKALVGKSCMIDELPFLCTFGAFVTVLRPKENVEATYLSLLMNSEKSTTYFYERSSNTTNISNLRVSDLLELTVPLPPLPEQKRIAAILTEQLAAVSRARAAAEAQLQAINQLPAAYLQVAFTGATSPAEVEKSKILLLEKYFGVSSFADWKPTKLGDVCLINPRRPELKRADDAPTTFIQMSAVDENGRGVKRPEQRPFREVRKGYTYFEEGDILFAKITPCMQNGKHAIATDLIEGYAFGSTEFHVIRPHAGVSAEWVHKFLIQPSILRDATEHFTGAVGQQRIPDAYLAALNFLLPPLDEQERIAKILAEQFTIVECAETASNVQLQHINQLPATLLRQAFSGEL